MARYASLDDLKTYLRISDTTDDGVLGDALDVATELIDLALGTADAQLAPVPVSIKVACEIQASKLAKRRDAPFGILGAEEFGNYVRLYAKLDPDVELLLNDYGDRKKAGTV